MRCVQASLSTVAQTASSEREGWERGSVAILRQALKDRANNVDFTLKTTGFQSVACGTTRVLLIWSLPSSIPDLLNPISGECGLGICILQ